MRAFLTALALFMATAAIAGIMQTDPLTGPIGGASGVFPGGPENGLTGAATGSGATPPVGCDGTIDLSTGCPQPMLGVI